MPRFPGFGPIALLSRVEARQVRIRNGEPLPLLSEVLELVGDREVYVEVKSLPEAHDEALLAVLDRGPAPAPLLGAQLRPPDHPAAGRLPRPSSAAASCSPPTSTTRWRRCAASGPRRCGRSGSRWIGIWSTRCTTPASRIIAWTVNEIGDLERMARLGVDGLCGNYPDRIRVAIATRVEEVSRT